jgi:sugar O-acyltransferase (sialic acid O-acetyltransferase NeuD family)
LRKPTWTIFGVGNLIGDLIDAIESRHQKADNVVLNMDPDETKMRSIPPTTKIIELNEFKPSTDFYIFGFVDPNKESFLSSLRRYNLRYSNLIHKFSYVPKNVSMGEGNFIGAGVVLATHIKMGDFNYINRSASIGHDTHLLSFNELGPGCTIAGNCEIGCKNHFYSGSVVINNMHIGDNITIGAGGVVIRDILEPGIYTGVPAKKLK